MRRDNNSNLDTKSHFSNIRKKMKLRMEDVSAISKNPFEIKGLSPRTTINSDAMNQLRVFSAQEKQSPKRFGDKSVSILDSNKFETQIDSHIHSNDLFNDSVRTIYSQIARKAQKGNASVQNP